MLTGSQLRDEYLSGTELAAVDVTTTGFAVEAIKDQLAPQPDPSTRLLV